MYRSILILLWLFAAFPVSAQEHVHGVEVSLPWTLPDGCYLEGRYCAVGGRCETRTNCTTFDWGNGTFVHRIREAGFPLRVEAGSAAHGEVLASLAGYVSNTPWSQHLSIRGSATLYNASPETSPIPYSMSVKLVLQVYRNGTWQEIARSPMLLLEDGNSQTFSQAYVVEGRLEPTDRDVRLQVLADSCKANLVPGIVVPCIPPAVMGLVDLRIFGAQCYPDLSSPPDQPKCLGTP